MIGLHIMRPTSIVVAGGGSETASVRADGGVDFSSATSLSLNGVFTAGYDNYMISVRHLHSATDIVELNIRLRLSGTDATGSNYTFQRLSSNGTTVDGSRSSAQTTWRMGSASNVQRSGSTIYVYGPNLAQSTAARSVDTNGFTNATITEFAGTHAVATAYDGVTVYPASGAITGMITVYGYAQ